VPLLALAAAILGDHPINAVRTCLRDGEKHPSPNAGLAEATVAGALGVQLGGLNYYGGEPHEGALLGDPLEPLEKRHILSVNILAFGTALLFLLVFVGLRALARYKQ
jgi:adenosylcobinamide-phosphate synthase